MSVNSSRQSSDPIQRFLDSVVDPAAGFTDVFSPDASLDATVPNWRFTVRGVDNLRAELARWFADPGTFDSVIRVPMPDGELVQFDLSWLQDGTPHAVHQAHVLTVSGDRITADTAWCGGRWSASALAEREAAAINGAWT
jgi:hypothetical protein